MSQIQTSSLMTGYQQTHIPFGAWLTEHGLINEDQLQEALAQQKKMSGRLGDVLVKTGVLNDVQVAEALGRYLSVESASLEDFSTIDAEIARRIPENIAKRLCLVAIGRDDENVIVALADPLNVVAIDTVTVKLKRKVKVVVAPARRIMGAIDYIYHGGDVDQQQMKDIVDLQIQTDDDSPDRVESNVESEEPGVADAQDAPVIRFVDLMLSHAIKSRASDIHIEPQEKTMSIRMRVDGILADMVPPSRTMQAAVIARLKILSEMDIAERRLPQDGRFRIRMGRDRSDIDVRVSVLPTIYGEKVVLRILDKSSVNHSLASLGLEAGLLDKLKQILQQPHGIIIVTGPTGSGKSTTLYSALSELRDPRKNITTVEDPVEYRLGGINQTQVKPEINLDFALCLRAILRQDPDIILIGEIRDRETMEIAIKASMTGHLVLSTFHTNDAPSAISRLMYMGLETYLLASSLNLILAQRLVRRVCEKCRKPTTLSDELIKKFKISDEELRTAQLYQGSGCSHCNNSGYRGRVPIFEFLVVDSEMRQAIAEGAKENDIRMLARQKGYGDLLSSGVRRVLQGLTTPEEILRATFAEDIS